jgi:AcrR family transcriptional regulator
MPRPKSLELSELASAALAVIDRDGLEALSIRAVASELGVGTMSLYRYVEGREALERLVVDLVLRDVDLTVPPRTPWTKGVTLVAERIRRAVLAHPAVVPLFMSHRHASVATRRAGDALLGMLTEAGFSGVRRVVAFRALLAYLVGALESQHRGPLAGSGTDTLAALSVAEFPYLSETAKQARSVSADTEFREGLAIVLRGLGAYLNECK